MKVPVLDCIGTGAFALLTVVLAISSAWFDMMGRAVAAETEYPSASTPLQRTKSSGASCFEAVSRVAGVAGCDVDGQPSQR